MSHFDKERIKNLLILNFELIKQQILILPNEIKLLTLSFYFNKIKLIEFQSIYLIIWFLSSILLLFSNKFNLINFNFNSTITLNFYQSFICLIFTRILALIFYSLGFGKSNLNWNHYLHKILPIGLSFSISIIANSIACNYLPLVSFHYSLLPFYQYLD